LGSGIITGASDDDPSGIATYSQAWAQLGFGMLWMVILLFPLMYTVQEMSGRIGLVTGSGLGKIIKIKYWNKVLLLLAGLLLISNIITIGADIGAMAASFRLLVPQTPILISILCFTIIILLNQIFISYKKFAKILKYIAISLFAYVITSINVGGNIQNILFSTFVPHVEITKNYAVIFAAIFGTTISPYLLFWQTSEEAEEASGKIKAIGKGALKK
jgi:Mn2+/Fe2+ NRAMP family transporter